MIYEINETSEIVVDTAIGNTGLFIIIIIIIIIIKTLFTFELECKIYRNEMITAKDKKVTHASQLRASGLQARLWETSHPKNAKAPRRKRRKLAHCLLWI